MVDQPDQKEIYLIIINNKLVFFHRLRLRLLVTHFQFQNAFFVNSKRKECPQQCSFSFLLISVIFSAMEIDVSSRSVSSRLVSFFDTSSEQKRRFSSSSINAEKRFISRLSMQRFEKHISLKSQHRFLIEESCKVRSDFLRPLPFDSELFFSLPMSR